MYKENLVTGINTQSTLSYFSSAFLQFSIHTLTSMYNFSQINNCDNTHLFCGYIQFLVLYFFPSSLTTSCIDHMQARKTVSSWSSNFYNYVH